MTDQPAAGILDTSVFIASETDRQLNTSAIPDEVATTVITLAELNAGVLVAQTAEVRAGRMRTLDAISDMIALPVDEEAARLGRCCESITQKRGAGPGSMICGSRRSLPPSTCRSSHRMRTSTRSRASPISPSFVSNPGLSQRQHISGSSVRAFFRLFEQFGIELTP